MMSPMSCAFQSALNRPGISADPRSLSFFGGSPRVGAGAVGGHQRVRGMAQGERDANTLLRVRISRGRNDVPPGKPNWRVTMKKILLGALMTAGLTGAAFAATHVDTNGDGAWSLEEVSAAYPEIDADAFAAMDVNGDAVLDASEVAAAQDAGMLPKE
jgi:hypothetical protein